MRHLSSGWFKTSCTAFRQARARQKVVLVFSLRSTSKVLQSLQTETCVQISKHLLLALQRTKPQLHLPLLHPPRASFSQEQRLILIVGWPKLGGTYRSCIVRKCCSVLSYTARRAGLSDTRGGESGKENVASEKECWGLLHHYGMLQSHMKITISLLSVSWVPDFYCPFWQLACKLQKFVLSTAFDRDLYWRDENRWSKASTDYTSASRKTWQKYLYTGSLWILAIWTCIKKLKALVQSSAAAIPTLFNFCILHQQVFW